MGVSGIRIGHAKELLKKHIASGKNIPIMLVGDSGVGKSQIVAQVAKELGIEIIDKRLAQMEPGDLIGIPRADAKGDKTTWLKPDWFPTNPESRGILFLDEINRAPLDMRQAVFQILTEWRIHNHVLPKSWAIVTAINPAGGSFQVEEMCPAMVSRVVRLDVEASAEDWIDWAKKHQVNEQLIQYINSDPKMLNCRAADSENKPYPCPRTWAMVSDMINAGTIELADLEHTRPLLVGCVGMEATLGFAKFLKTAKKPISGKEVLKEYTQKGKSHKERILERDKHGNLAYTNDMFYATISDIKSEYPEKGSLPDEEKKNLLAFMKDAPKEYVSQLIKDLSFKTSSEFLSEFSNIPEFGEIIHEIENAKKGTPTTDGDSDTPKRGKKAK